MKTRTGKPESDLPEYVRRCVDGELDVLFGELSAMSIEGPKGVGKTVTAARRSNTRYDLDEPTMLELIRADPAQLVGGTNPS